MKSLTIKDLSFKRARKFYFAAIAAGTALVQGNFVHGGVAQVILGTIAVLSAMSVWFFPNEPSAARTKTSVEA